MSFDNENRYTDLEQGSSPITGRYVDHPQFSRLLGSIDSQLKLINQTQIGEAKRCLRSLESGQDGPELAAAAQKSFDNVTSSFKHLDSLLKLLHGEILQLENGHEDVEVINYLKQKEQIQAKLTRLSLINFKSIQRRFQEMHTIPDGDPVPDDAISKQNQDSSFGHQQQVLISYEPINAEELEHQSLLIEERERELHRIQQDTLQINDIFHNLSSLVNEQQFQVDDIESNLFNFEANARGATLELRLAERYQRRSRGRMLCCMMIVIGIVSLMVLIMILF